MTQAERQRAAAAPQAPPTTWGATLLRLGPGMIIAGSIVGSGELIATTKVGAEAGFALLWLIIAGCIIKVFAQVEFGRHAIAHGETPLESLNRVPGPRLRVNWVIWAWAAMTLLIVTQQGGIVGGLGQVLAMSVPITEQGRHYNEVQDDLVRARVQLAALKAADAQPEEQQRLAAQIETLAADPPREPNDAYVWGVLVALVTAGLLWFGRYGLIQAVATVLVAGFTAVTILTLILLQLTDWSIRGEELADGLRLHLPPRSPTTGNPVGTAMAAFGIIGVGAAELIMYPYWCLEKGYARYTGPRDGSPGWLDRARGWLRVLQLDAWTSMVVYTFATVAFYLLGAAVLWRVGLNPQDAEMIRTLAQMYVPVFGVWAETVFLVGAFGVLYSTFFVAAAGCARMVADGMGLYGLHDGSEAARGRWVRRISLGWPLAAVALYLTIQTPTAMILWCGIAQAMMLPILGVAALYFRYGRLVEGLRPGRFWDVMLWLSVAGLSLAGLWAVWSKLPDVLPWLR